MRKFDTTLVCATTITGGNFSLSDARLKTKIQPISLDPVEAAYKEFEMIDTPGIKRYGVIAQELIKTNPELVRCEEGIYSVNYIDLLIKEIAILKAKVEELEKKIQ